MDMAENDAQRIYWEAHEAKQLGLGVCPDSGEKLLPVMDWWNRRVLTCAVCDCFGYPLVMSDGSIDTYNQATDPDMMSTGDLTDGAIDW